MVSVQATQSSGSEEDPKKRKRMLSNRESARRSRMRKQQHLDDLVSQVAKLKDENSQIQMQANLLTQQYFNLDTENTVLRTQVMELSERLRSLNSVLQAAEQFTGMAMDIPSVPDRLLKPWQLPEPLQPILTSANMFQC